MSGGGFWAAVGDPRYNRAEVVQDPNEADPSDRGVVGYGPGVVDQSGALWPGGQSAYPDAQDVTGYAYDSGQPPDPAFHALNYYAEVGEQVHELEPLTLPYRQGQGFQEQGFASPTSFRPRLSAMTNQDPIGPLQQRVNPGISSVAVPDADLLAGFPLGRTPRITTQAGYVTRWPTAQMVYRPMGSDGGDG